MKLKRKTTLKATIRNNGFVLVALFFTVLVSGCLTSQEPFYQDEDVVSDDRLLGDFVDPNDKSQPPTHFYVSEVDTHYLKGHYYVTVQSSSNCSMRFHAVLFKAGTNRFLDMAPEVESCDRVAGGPPSLIELLKSVTLQPLHLAMKVDVNTNDLKIGFVEHSRLMALTRKSPEFFQKPKKPESFPRLVPDTKQQREFLIRFSGDTNVFTSSVLKRQMKSK